MKRRVIPYSVLDKFFAVMIPVFAATAIGASLLGYYWWALLHGLGIVPSVMTAYVLQDQPPRSAEENKYAVVIGSIAEIGKRLSSLSTFLEQERARVAQTEAIVAKLNEEKAKLEPIVQTQKDTVEAILAAHAHPYGSRRLEGALDWVYDWRRCITIGLLRL